EVEEGRGGGRHIDLQEVRLDQPITASVAVHLTGGEDAPGVREGGVLSQPLREVQVSALPLEVPEHIDLDVSQMATGDTLRIADIAPGEGVTLLAAPEAVVAAVPAPTRGIEPEEVPEEGELPEGEAAEGEAAEGEEQGEPGADAAGDDAAADEA